MSTLARRRNRDTNTWPGFVDALASLLMVIIFVLMIFIVAQFYLTQILSGKDETLARLNQQIAELTDLLSLEREANAELRVTVAQLSAELQSSLSTRDRLSAQVDRLTSAQATLESRLADLTRERAVLQGRIDTLEASRTGVDARLLEVLKERDALLGKLAEVEQKERIATSERDAIAADLERALEVVDANRETIELQLRDLERLRRDLAAIRSVRDDLENQVAALAALRERLRAELDDANRTISGLETDLTSANQDIAVLRSDLSAAGDEIETLESELSDEQVVIAALRAELAAQAEENASLRATLETTETSKQAIEADLSQALTALQALRTERAALEAAREALREELSKAAARIAVLDRDLSTANRNTEALLDARTTLRGEVEKAASEIAGLTQSLGVARDTTKALEARLANQTERTLLAQREIEARDIRLEELFSELTATQATLASTSAALSAEEEISSEAQQQVALLNAQIAALRQQLARIEEALEISERENQESKARIVDLGRRLNAALATKVQELARFRSEFFGRLREVLSGRQDIRVVGDRFVFQSEVLFESGSADIGLAGQQSLGQLATALQDIAERIPDDINWILQIEGHTDSIPIFNEQFANNWELSAARAISVVEFLIGQGIPAGRLSATGYGEFQPIDAANLNRNRRIELKLTQR